MAIKLIATDIDGTLVNDERKITSFTRKVLKQARAKGVYVVLCTGRPVSGIQNYIEQLELNTTDDFAITFNGAQIQNIGTNEVIARNEISIPDCIELANLSHQLGIKAQIVTADSDLYVFDQDISRYSVKDAFYTNMELHYREISQLSVKATKFMWADEPNKISKTIKQIPQEIKSKYYIVRSEPFFLEFTSPQATKGHAVIELAQKLGIKQNEIMTVGDENNDLTMLEAVKHSVAMGNGNEKVKQVASYITDDNNHDGLGKAVEKFVL
ncbi:Cof-type HAD-IIB family hydrolase [Ligilactobacillus cholophilus]|uniref:Cof-type HAD-IIB family hydrolase n=1 Tax=Ligilactobacillus cholophilus TaxID=3050131 RepID=UPI0025B176C3|nr:Cof-type HAD-IIB family hydrolase [Ligilactobacillus cholophilus]